MNNKYKPSNVWDKINNSIIPITSEKINYDTFRRADGVNTKITTWNPYEPSLRYFKHFLMNIIVNSDENFITTYNQIQNTNLGDPISIIHNNQKYNLDYILSTNELIFIRSILPKVQTICEIGAGFGRTAHTLLNTTPNIKSYYIIDLPNCLYLTQEYLKKVLLPHQYDKCVFISTDVLEETQLENIDLYINIDSFAEMDENTIINYLELIKISGKYFYCKNPIGKYSVKDIGLLNINKEDIDNIYQTGLCRQTLDLYDYDNLMSYLDSYVEKYNPGGEFKPINFNLASPFYFYGNVLYTTQ